MIELKKLAKHQKDILLAEIAAWLHDVGKCTDALFLPDGLGFKAERCKDKPQVNPHKAVFSPDELKNLPYWNKLSPQRGQCARLEEAKHRTAVWRTLKRLGLKIPDSTISFSKTKQIQIRELILWGRPLVSDKYNAFQNILDEDLNHLAAILGRAHACAHMEKEKEADGGQSNCIETPFGFIAKIYQKLDEKLKMVFSALSVDNRNRIEIIQNNFIEAPGDTRRPINEVTLWDWSSTVAALYKSEISRCVLLDEKRLPQNLKWKLLNIRFDGLSFLFKNAQIPDMLARYELLKNALNKVQDLLEESYPLGLEMYRDENGSLFVVPDIDNLLENAKNENNESLKSLIISDFNKGSVKANVQLRIEGEIIPAVELSESWDGIEKLPPVGEYLKKPLELEVDPNKVSNWWYKVKPEELCTVCGLRPQGPDPKAKSRNVCNVCEERRADRSEDWVANLGKTTIWVNEVADVNGRYFLLVGAFDLEKWLSGDLVYSLAVRNPENVSAKSYEKIAKNPSFARMRRIWETTRQFWQEVLPTDEMYNFRESLVAKVLGESGPRLALRGKITDREGRPKKPGYFHTYELVTEKRHKLSVVWDANKKRFISVDNLVYVARIIGKHLPKRDEKKKDEEYYEKLNKWVATELKQVFQGKLKIEEPTGYGVTNKEFGTLEVEGVPEIIEGSGFIPAIPILAEPKTFMALLPANKALDIIKAIKEKYEREMGKVRNRLPLHLGIVYAHRRTPLRAVIDAGRRMLQQSSQPVGWKVTTIEEKNIDDGDLLPQRFDTDRNGQFKKWFEISLKRNGSSLTWYIPAVMGDGKTDDHWYPYVFLDTTPEPSDRTRYFKAPNPWNKNEECWLVHAGELKEGDKVYFTPATFDFEWLDVSARRFEIAYEKENGQRKERLTRPYLLDELTELDEIWEALSTHLTKNQIYAIRDTIEDRRKEWQPDENDLKENDGMFWQFCRDVLLNANWKNEPWPKNERDKWLNKWATYAARGWLTDVVELHFHIIKEEIETKQTEEVTT